MFFTKKGINDKNDKNFQSNLTLYKLDQSTKSGVRTLGVKSPIHGGIELQQRNIFGKIEGKHS